MILRTSQSSGRAGRPSSSRHRSQPLRSTVTQSIVLVDDDREYLGEFRAALDQQLERDEAEVRTWAPSSSDDDPRRSLESLLDGGTVLVITDYNLTRQGLTGLFGSTIVSWCQDKAIPVGDFSRAHHASLPSEPDLFELRVPVEMEAATAYALTMFRGFRAIRDAMDLAVASPDAPPSPATALARMLGHPELEGQIALYMTGVAASNSALLDRIRSSPDGPTNADKAQLLAYVIGHVLVNGVLRYPGPILSERALCAYLATTPTEGGAVAELFTSARYVGPFSSAAYYWRSGADAILEGIPVPTTDQAFETSGAYNRALAESALRRTLVRHDCPRCAGANGGYYCPFTTPSSGRPVCERADCSVGSSSLLPAGADVCRIERDFFDEWAPMIGL